MRPLFIIGIILIALGVIVLTHHGITYTTREAVVDVGRVHVDVTKKKKIPLPPILGGLAVVAGAVMTLAAIKRPKTS